MSVTMTTAYFIIAYMLLRMSSALRLPIETLPG